MPCAQFMQMMANREHAELKETVKKEQNFDVQLDLIVRLLKAR